MQGLTDLDIEVAFEHYLLSELYKKTGELLALEMIGSTNRIIRQQRSLEQAIRNPDNLADFPKFKDVGQ